MTTATSGAAWPIRPCRPREDAVRLPRDAPGADPAQARRPLRHARSRRRDAQPGRRRDAGRTAAPTSSSSRTGRTSRAASSATREMEGMLDGHALCVSARPAGTVFLAVRMGLFRSNDRAAKLAGHGGRPLLARHLRPRYPRLAAGPARALRVPEPGRRSEDGSLYRSGDLGETLDARGRRREPSSTMMAVALHPRDAKQIYTVARNGQVFGNRTAAGVGRVPAARAGQTGLRASLRVKRFLHSEGV